MKVTKTFIAKCIQSPQGREGLEGYQIGLQYIAQQVEMKGGKIHYRVFPDSESDDLGYYETCSAKAFRRFFV